MNQGKRRRTLVGGFTLIEALVAMALIGMVLSVLVAVLFGYNNYVKEQQANIEVVRAASLVIHEFQTLATQANRVVESMTIDGTTYTTGQSAVVLELLSVDGNGSVIYNAYDYAVIYATGTAAIRLLEPNAASARLGGSRTLTAALESLSFFYDSASPGEVTRIEAEVHTRREIADRVVESKLRQQVYLRNK